MQIERVGRGLFSYGETGDGVEHEARFPAGHRDVFKSARRIDDVTNDDNLAVGVNRIIVAAREGRVREVRIR